MTLNRRSLLVTGGAALGGALASAAGARGQTPAAGVDGSKSAALFVKDDDGLAPATFDRLPLEPSLQMSRPPWSEERCLVKL